MANLQYTSEILDDVLLRAGEPTDGTSDYETKVLEWLNRAYLEICGGVCPLAPDVNEDWWWLRSANPGVLVLQPKKSLTAAITNNSTTVTLSAVEDDSLVGWFMKVPGQGDVFRVSAHTAGTDAVTLDSVYTRTTNATASVEFHKVDYTLPTDLDKIIYPIRAYQDGEHEIDGVETRTLNRDYPLATVNSGVPREFSLIGEQTIRFSHSGGTSDGDYIRVDFDYLILPTLLTDSGSEEPLLPRKYRYVLADYALFLVFTDMEDTRADGIGAFVRANLTNMALENNDRMVKGSNQIGRIYPRGKGTRKRLPRTVSGLRLR